ncbi:hypothetical protein FRC00_001636 [Tulasnella sp. 408]|nr:hypothetical protein FRC00_001636 [Tulasnella sp. 408]
MKLKHTKSQDFGTPSCPDTTPAQPRTFDLAIGITRRLGKLVIPKYRTRQRAAETAHQNRLQNAQTPISRLPLELFLEIIVHAINWMYWSIRQLQLLATVSTHWREVILSSPQCWAVLNGSHEPREWRLILARNPARLIDVRCSGGRIEEFVPLALAAAPRTSALTLWVNDKNELVEKMFGVPFPALRYLLVSNGAMDQKVIPSLGEGVHLRHLELYKTSMRWDEPRLANLSTLCLSSLWGGYPTVSQLYTILSCSPNLERLHLLDWKDVADTGDIIVIRDPESPESASDQEQPTPPNFPPIQLNRLTTLIATSLPSQVVTFLFSVLCALSCRTLHVTHDGGDKTAHSILDFAVRIIEAAPCIALKLVTYSSYMGISSEPRLEMPATWALWSKDIPGLDVQLMNLSDVKALSNRIAEATDSRLELAAMPLTPLEEHTDEDM